MQILKKIQKAKKLKALADRGDGGERESAKTFYEDYLKKNNFLLLILMHKQLS